MLYYCKCGAPIQKPYWADREDAVVSCHCGAWMKWKVGAPTTLNWHAPGGELVAARVGAHKEALQSADAEGSCEKPAEKQDGLRLVDWTDEGWKDEGWKHATHPPEKCDYAEPVPVLIDGERLTSISAEVLREYGITGALELCGCKSYSLGEMVGVKERRRLAEETAHLRSIALRKLREIPHCHVSHGDVPCDDTCGKPVDMEARVVDGMVTLCFVCKECSSDE